MQRPDCALPRTVVRQHGVSTSGFALLLAGAGLCAMAAIQLLRG